MIWTTPEFWTAIAFVGVLIILMRPLRRVLRTWTEKQAGILRQRQQEAEDVLKKAQELHQTYETGYRGRMAERQKMMLEADSEIAALEENARRETAERITRRRQEVAVRLKTMADNGRQNLQQQMLDAVVAETKKQLEERSQVGTENMDDTVNRACQMLETYRPVLNKH